MDCKFNFIFLKDKLSGKHDLEFVYKVFCIFLNFRFEATEHLILPLWRLKGRAIASVLEGKESKTLNTMISMQDERLIEMEKKSALEAGEFSSMLNSELFNGVQNSKCLFNSCKNHPLSQNFVHLCNMGYIQWLHDK